MNETETRKILAEVALGNTAPDTLIINGTVFNVFTREFIADQSIWIKQGRIAYVGPDRDPQKTEQTKVLDADGMVVLPGLIDGHTHIAATKSTVEEFIKHVIPGGTTTVVTETMDLPFIAGEDGLKHWVKAFEDQPIRIYYTVPPLCGLTPAEEIHALSAEALSPYLSNPLCLGLGEIYWSNVFVPGIQGERVTDLALETLELGKRVEGHTAGASGRKLQAYSCLGISSCHEPITADEVLERLRLGYSLMIREGSVRRELERVKDIFRRGIDLRRLVLSTDSVDPVDLLDEGYLENSLRHALALGVEPAIAYQMVTINVAEHFRLDDLLGSLAPGRMADLLFIPSSKEFSPRLVMAGGKIIYRDGRVLVELRKSTVPDHLLHTVNIEGYALPPLPRAGKIRVMELVTNLVTKEKVIDLDAPEESKDVIMAFALDRVGKGRSFLGLIKGFGLKKGAFGSTLSWDTGDMLVLGCDGPSIATAIERLKENQGGYVYAISKQVIEELPMPLCGIISLKPMEFIRKRMRRIEEALRGNGVPWEKPILTVETLTTAAIPHLRITHRGYVRVKDREVLPLEA